MKMDVSLTLDVLMDEITSDFFNPMDHVIDYAPDTPLSQFSGNSCPASPAFDKNSSEPVLDVASISDMEWDPEIEREIERMLAEEDGVIYEAVAAAVQLFESLDVEFNDECASAKSAVSTLLSKCEDDGRELSDELQEGEYLVRSILKRRLIKKKRRRTPTNEDFEYLVAWEGYGPEDNTWEPHHHIKNCTGILEAFHDRLRTEALHKRKGKRL